MAGAIVLMSTSIVPFDIGAEHAVRAGEHRLTSGPSGSIVTMRVAVRATSAGDVGRLRAGGDEFVDRPRLRLWTTTEKPFLRRLSAMGLPMRPSPMNPTVLDMPE